MKISILYAKPEWSEMQFIKIFDRLGYIVEGIDIHKLNKTTIKQLKDRYLVLNRLLPSAASKQPNFKLNNFLSMLCYLEKNNVRLINCTKASRADYDKYYAMQCMKSFDVRTPNTFKTTSLNRAKKILKKIGFPRHT